MHCQFCTRVSHETLLRKSSLCHLSTFRSRITVATSDTGDFQNRQIHITQATAQVEKCTNMLKYEWGRVQTDGEYKLLILLIYLSRTIKSHMHHAGSYEIQIPTEYGSVTYLDLIAANLQYLDWVNRNTSVDSDHCQCLYHLSFKRADPRHEAS